METEAKANSPHCFLGENGCSLRLCSSRIDETVVLLKLVTLSGSSVVVEASWTLTLKEAASNLLVIFKIFH